MFSQICSAECISKQETNKFMFCPQAHKTKSFFYTGIIGKRERERESYFYIISNNIFMPFLLSHQAVLTKELPILPMTLDQETPLLCKDTSDCVDQRIK